jgi:hypothetical protein
MAATRRAARVATGAAAGQSAGAAAAPSGAGGGGDAAEPLLDLGELVLGKVGAFSFRTRHATQEPSQA